MPEEMEKVKLLLVHGGTRRIESLTQLIENRGFEVTVSRIPAAMIAKCSAVVFAGGSISAGSYRMVKNWSREFIQSINVPFLGICLGHLMLGLAYGATYRTLAQAEYGPTSIRFREGFPLAPGAKELTLWEDHIHELVHIPLPLRNYGSSESTKIQAIKHVDEDKFGVQFHPEVEDTDGLEVLENFLTIAHRR